MKAKWSKLELLGIIAIVVLFVSVSILSIVSINNLNGNARVVNYVGIVRGATQKLIKEELMGHPDDALIERLDIIINELLTGDGPNNLVRLPDNTYLSNMQRVKESWIALKVEILAHRNGSDPEILYESSQKYFELVNDTVFSAEAYSERQLKRTNIILIGINVIFSFLIFTAIILYVRNTYIRRQAETLNQLAYTDKLTQIDNRASTERLLAALRENPPADDIAVFVFDMNNLKHINDAYGHRGGDKVIAAFAQILKQVSHSFGFVARYGGDEFLAVIEHCTEGIAQEFSAQLAAEVAAYNKNCDDKLEQISYAFGYVIDNVRQTAVSDMVFSADQLMYEYKRKQKETGHLYV